MSTFKWGHYERNRSVEDELAKTLKDGIDKEILDDMMDMFSPINILNSIKEWLKQASLGDHICESVVGPLTGEVMNGLSESGVFSKHTRKLLVDPSHAIEIVDQYIQMETL